MLLLDNYYQTLVNKQCPSEPCDRPDFCVCVWEQGWRSGEGTRLPPMWPGFDSRSRCHVWVEFVVGSRPCSERFFSGYSGFPLSIFKTNTSKFQLDLERTNTFKRASELRVSFMGKQVT